MPLVAIPLIAVALVVLIIWFAGYQLHLKAFQGIADQGGTVGGLLLRWFLSGIQRAIDGSIDWVREQISPLISLFTVPIHWIQTHIDDLTTGLFNLYQSVFRLATYTVPHLIGNAMGVARGWVAQAEALATSQVTQVYHWAAGQFAGVYQYVNAEISLAEGYTRQLVAQAEAYAAAGIHADAVYAEQLYQQSIGYTNTAIHGVEGWVTGEVGTLTKWTDGQITALQKWIEANQAAVTTWTQALVGAVAVDLANLKLECTDNLCENLGGAANWLKSLSGPLGIAAFYALVAEAAADPVGTATLVDDTLGPLAAGAADGFRALAGV